VSNATITLRDITLEPWKSFWSSGRETQNQLSQKSRISAAGQALEPIQIALQNPPLKIIEQNEGARDVRNNPVPLFSVTGIYCTSVASMGLLGAIPSDTGKFGPRLETPTLDEGTAPSYQVLTAPAPSLPSAITRDLATDAQY
jgi:hypothetical protein